MLALYNERALLTGLYATNQDIDDWAYLTSSQGTKVPNATAVFMQGAPGDWPGTTVDTSKSFDRSLRPVRMFEPVITPSVGTVSATANTAITPVTFTAAGFGTEIITYTVAPTLPTGLSLNAGTGEVLGTPTVATAAADYVVTATGGGVTTATATINITVKAAAITPVPVPTPATPETPTTPVTPAPSPISPVTPVVPVALSPAQFMLGLTPTQVQRFTADELAALPPAAFAVMSPAQVKALNPAQMSGFSAALIQAIPARSLRAMKPATLKKFSVTQIRALTQEQASDLRAKQIKALGPVKRKIVNSKL
jgi:hypothetical protein